MKILLLFSALLWACVPGLAQDDAVESGNTVPKPIPQFRPEMKLALESLKSRQPRLPFPPQAEGERSVNNGRARAFYLPESWSGRPRSATPSPSGPAGTTSNRGRQSDPDMTLDNTFKVRLFWIVSRVNNCQYCLGHQELKLTRAGMEEDRIAELDCDWSTFPESEQVAFAFTRKLTLEPHLVNPQDIAVLQQHYTDPQIVEIVQTVAGYNATNRWTDSLGLPQDDAFGGEPANLLTETSTKYQKSVTVVAPLTEPTRPAWETRSQVEEKFSNVLTRTANVALQDLSILPSDVVDIAERLGVENYARALGTLPSTARRQLAMFHGIVNEGLLPNRIKAQILWTVSRENRAWYSAAHARRWLLAEGMSENAIYEVDHEVSVADRREHAAVSFARKLTSHPRQIADDDVAQLRKHFSDHEVAEIVYMTCFSNNFSHLTEALSLPFEQ